jgi:type II secretory ATPase GspE/PulE/Tfp pilus assembly ATPase PilB-like protein
MSQEAEVSPDVQPVPLEELPLEHLEVDQAIAQVIHQAAHMPASDVFLGWEEDRLQISVHHLGILKKLTSVPRETGRRFINYFKAMTGMDLSTSFRPQDGRWVHELLGGRKLDLRLNTIPTLYGEDLAIRLLERNMELLELENLGLLHRDVGQVRQFLRNPGGLLLVTGPSGSGKTTTLYACLHHLNDGTRKINTIEDPVEYAMDGVRQSAINPKIHLDFPEMLRSVLRQAPDVIMVGEIRDPITAETAVRAANSGHLVLATLHAPIASAAIDAMFALGVHPHFLATCLLGILTQRLLRTLCPQCRQSYDISESPQTFEEVRPWLEPGQGDHIYAAPGCDTCHMEGYGGRTGVFEVLGVSKPIRRMIAENRSAREIRDKAVEEGMIDMRRSALLKVAGGITSTEEVMRAIPSEHLLPEQ